MSMPWWLPVLSYLSLLVFFVGVALRAAKYARAPVHLRWELYPIPHEKGKEYGGSYFEDVDWWTRPRKTSLGAEVRAMLEEILLIRSLWRRNRPHWYASFPFHAGLYLLVSFTLVLVVGAALDLTSAFGNRGDVDPLRSGLRTLTVAVGAVGLGAATLGVLGLLWRRLSDPPLRAASCPADYANLLFLLAVFLTAGFAWLSADPGFSHLRGYVASLMALRPLAEAPVPVQVEVAAASLLLTYLPFTHMIHFVAKYFTYHQVRWDDAPNLGDPGLEGRLRANLARPVGWAGPHIQPDKSWAEVASEVK
jgi:nitrate reductase gamma subunit